MKKLFAAAVAAIALSFTMSAVSVDVAVAAPKKPAMKACHAGKGKKAQSWKCMPDQTCCVTAEGKGVCGISGLGCF